MPRWSPVTSVVSQLQRYAFVAAVAIFGMTTAQPREIRAERPGGADAVVSTDRDRLTRAIVSKPHAVASRTRGHVATDLPLAPFTLLTTAEIARHTSISLLVDAPYDSRIVLVSLPSRSCRGPPMSMFV